jgi:pimeloyl-ACP methyl ester carboxylesterase
VTAIYSSAAGAAAVERRYREYLDQWPVPCRQLRVPTRQGETFVVASGPADGPPVLLLHGAGANAAMWLGDIASWSRQHRVYAVDVIGEPGRSAPSRPPLASDAYRCWLDDVLAGLGVATAAFVGVSLGGWLAADYATGRPDRVDRLVLVCPGGIGRQRLRIVPVALALAPFGERGRRALMRIVLGPDARAALPPGAALTEYVLLINRHVRPRRVRLPVFGDDALRRLTMPTLAIVGGRDMFFDSDDTRRRLERTVPGVTIDHLPGSGHLLVGQTERISGFLTEGR